jgi:hypothetical protein
MVGKDLMIVECVYFIIGEDYKRGREVGVEFSEGGGYGVYVS